MNVFVFRGAKVAAKEERLDPFEESWICRHHVFELPVLRAILTHHHLTIVFDDLRFDFARMLVHEGLERNLTTDHGVTNFFDATWTKTICLTWKPEWRRSAFVGFEEWTRRPGRPNRFALGQTLVDRLKRLPGYV
jgi:hypothetical protein